MSRAMYAQLVQQRFRAPKCYPEMPGRVRERGVCGGESGGEGGVWDGDDVSRRKRDGLEGRGALGRCIGRPKLKMGGHAPVARTLKTPRDILRQELEKQKIRRELEKEEIRRQIIAVEIERRRELEEEVKREMQLVPHRPYTTPLNIFSGPKPQLFTHTHLPNKDKVIILPRPKVVVQGAKRPKPSAGDEGEPSPLNLQKKPKHQWNCALCQISTTCEKGLNDHFRGRKHRAKESSLNPKIGKSKLLKSKNSQIHLFTDHCYTVNSGLKERVKN
ncbi:hypothetical protein Fmac_012977 [Flemingia macrophylla]|uniref:C2H2-type domain-containing protein n=1 Tax=Flemingia macrophylla TaxID=520843 RepID=A0ABD1MRT9_9FABA